MNIEGFDNSLLTQKFAKGEVEYYLRKGSIIDRSLSIQSLTVSTTNWVKWDDPQFGDVAVELPGFALGHKLLMLGAKVILNSRVVHVDQLAVWNMDTRKGYFMYKSAPDADKHTLNKTSEDLDKMSSLCFTTRDLGFTKILMYALPLTALAVAISAYLETKAVLKSLVLAVVSFFLLAAGGYWLMRGSRNEIVARVSDISRSLKYEIRTEHT